MSHGRRAPVGARMKKIVWWSIKIICGAAAVYGAFIVAFSTADLFFLLTGRVQPDYRQPSVAYVSALLGVGLVLMIGGYKAPTWFNIDRLL